MTDPAPPAIPDALPVLPLRGGTVLFPLTVVPLLVGQERSIRLIDEVMRRDRMLAVGRAAGRAPDAAGARRSPRGRHGRPGPPARTHARRHAAYRPPGGRSCAGRGFRLDRAVPVVARVQVAPDQVTRSNETEVCAAPSSTCSGRLVSLADDMPGELGTAGEALEDPLHVAYLVAATAPIAAEDRQAVLELDPIDAKLRKLVELLQHEVAVRELGQKIRTETTERMSKTQREYFLREQLGAIQRELGDEGDPEIADLRRRVAEAEMPDDARREAERELERLATIPAASPEHGIIRTYLD